MSNQTQKKHMKEIGELLCQDLGYIFGEHESGPNGAKKRFLDKSAAFLRALGKDLGFVECKVTKNPAGIACSGDVSLYGLWSEGNGVYFKLEETCGHPHMLLYRNIRHMKDYTGGPNLWLSRDIFIEQDYERLCSLLLGLKTSEVCNGNLARAS